MARRNKPARQQVSRRRPSTAACAGERPPGRLASVVCAGAGGLFVARLLIPAEAAVLGDSLWITLLWFVVGALCCIDLHCRQQRIKTGGLLSVALGLMVGGHVVSGLLVVFGNGEKRAALNMLWEWVALGVSWFVFMQMLQSRDRSRMVVLVVAIATAQAGLGLWQHYVSFPEIVQRYDNLTQNLTEGDAAQRLEARKELASMGVPEDPITRQLWENRLRSTEPFGTFALANSLAGYLSAGLLLAAGLTLMKRPRDTEHPQTVSRGSTVLRAVCLLVLLYCLLLTKSRTAWVGTLAGGGVLLVHTVRSRSPQLGRWLLWAGLGIAGMIALLLMAAVTGGFDAEVLSEAPKSLAYRFQYWTASRDLILQHPVFGVGPGNFRHEYLRHKLPQSSEEIADPHNILLDLWSSGGLIAVAGLLLLLWVLHRLVWRRDSQDESATVDRHLPEISAWEWGAVAGVAGMMACELLFRFNMDLRWPAMCAGGMLVYGIWWQFAVDRINPVLLATAVVAWLVNLCGAGGAEMPAIMQTLGLLLIVAVPSQTVRNRESSQAELTTEQTAARQGLHAVLTLTAACWLAILGGLCWISAAMPVWQRQSLVNEGDSALMFDGNHRRAMLLYDEAAARDVFSPEPLERMAELSFQRWWANPQSQLAGNMSRDDVDFEKAAGFSKLAIARNPESPFGYWRLAKQYARKAGHQELPASIDLPQDPRSLAAARTAQKWYQQAVTRYPTNAELLTEYALVLHQTGDDKQAVDVAKQALAYDKISRNAGHTDRYLPDTSRTALTRLIDKATTP